MPRLRFKMHLVMILSRKGISSINTGDDANHSVLAKWICSSIFMPSGG